MYGRIVAPPLPRGTRRGSVARSVAARGAAATVPRALARGVPVFGRLLFGGLLVKRSTMVGLAATGALPPARASGVFATGSMDIGRVAPALPAVGCGL